MLAANKRSTASRPPDAAMISRTLARKRHVAAASVQRNTSYSHISCSMPGESFHSTFVLAKASARACARAYLLVALTEDDPRERIHVRNRAVALERHVDLRNTAHHLRLAEARIEALEVRDAIELRHDATLAVHHRGDRVGGRIQVVGLAGEEDQVVAGTHFAGDHRFRGDRRVAERALDAQSVARDLLAALGSHEEGDIRRARFRKPAAEIAADASGAEDE